MEENEASKHKLPSVETSYTEKYEEDTAATQMEQPSFGLGVPPSQAQPDDPGVTPTPLQTTHPVSVSSNGVDPLVEAEDVDLIEKAWVQKAKAIVKSTHGDPYVQNKELNKIKADYIKRRYNKDIKVVE